MVKQLVFDRRSGPAQNKLKSQEELAEEARTQMEQLEMEKRKRMDDLNFERSINQRDICGHYNPDDLESSNCFVEKRRKDPNAPTIVYDKYGSIMTTFDSDEGRL